MTVLPQAPRQLSDHYQEFRSAGAEVLGVVNATMEHAGRYVHGLNLSFPCLVDTERAVFDLYQVESRVLSLDSDRVSTSLTARV